MMLLGTRTHTHTQSQPWDDKHRDWSHKPENTNDCWQANRSTKRQGRIPLVSEEGWPCQHLNFGLVASRTMRQ